MRSLHFASSSHIATKSAIASLQRALSPSRQSNSCPRSPSGPLIYLSIRIRIRMCECICLFLELYIYIYIFLLVSTPLHSVSSHLISSEMRPPLALNPDWDGIEWMNMMREKAQSHYCFYCLLVRDKKRPDWEQHSTRKLPWFKVQNGCLSAYSVQLA